MNTKRWLRKVGTTAVASLASVGLIATSTPVAPIATAQTTTPQTGTGWTTDKGRLASSLYFFDFAKLAEGVDVDQNFGAKQFAGRQINAGNSHTYTDADGLPKGLEITVTVDSIKMPTVDEYNAEKAKDSFNALNADALINEGGIMASDVDWNHFFNGGTNPYIDGYQDDVRYLEPAGAMWGITQYIPENALAKLSDGRPDINTWGNLPVSFTVSTSAKLNGNPISLDLFAADGEATGARVEKENGHQDRRNGIEDSGGVPEHLRLETNGGDWEVIQNLYKDGTNHRWQTVNDPIRLGSYANTATTPVEAGINGKVYDWVDTEFDNDGNWMTDTLSQPILASRDASQLTVKLGNQIWGKTGSRQGAVMGVFLPMDHGDLPESYGSGTHLLTDWATNETEINADDRRVDMKSKYYIGGAVPAADKGQYSDDATEDSEEDLSKEKFFGLNDAGKIPGVCGEDGTLGNDTFKTTVPVGGPEAEDKIVTSWIDWNKDGKFQKTEKAVGTVQGGEAKLEWAEGVDQYKFGVLNARVRVATAEIEYPDDSVVGGEIEDLQMQQDCPVLDIVKKINGVDADTQPEAAVVAAESKMTVSFEVTNNGNVPLKNVTVTDDRIEDDETIDCDGDNIIDSLMPGGMIVCTAEIDAPDAGGSHVNVGTVTGDTPPTTITTTENGTPVTKETTPQITTSNPAHAEVPGLKIVKKIDEQDLNDPAAPATFNIGDKKTVTFEVENTGKIELRDVTVTDNIIKDETFQDVATLGDIKCDNTDSNTIATLAAGEKKTCTATMDIKAAGAHKDVATAAVTTTLPGTSIPGTTVVGTTDATTTIPGTTNPGITITPTPVTITPTDPLHVTVPPTTSPAPGEPAVKIIKRINGFDADTEPEAAVVAEGSQMDVTFEVTNLGNVDLTNVTVTDNKIAAEDIKCDDNNVVDKLLPGQSVTCEATFPAPAVGTDHVNVGTVTGDTPPTTVVTTENGTPVTTVTTPQVSETNPAHAVVPGLSIKKYINNDDANDKPVGVPADKPMEIKFVVKNTGKKDLVDVNVTDDKIAATNIVCAPATDNKIPTLAEGAEATCTATYEAPPAGEEHVNVGTAKGVVPPTTIPETVVPGTTIVSPGPSTTMTTVVPPTTISSTVVSPSTLTTTDPATATVTTSVAPEPTPVTATPEVKIIKKINGDDADTTPVTVAAGSDMNITFEVTNTGNATLDPVEVKDNVVPADDIKAPGEKKTVDGKMVPFTGSLEPGELAIFTATLKAPEAGQGHENIGTVNGGVPGTTVPPSTVTGTTNATTTVPGTTVPGTVVIPTTVTDNNPAKATVTPEPSPEPAPKNPAIKIVKMINGQNPNAAPGVEVAAGSMMDITYKVTNTGDTKLTNIKVTDEVYREAGNEQVTDISCPATELEPGADMTCSASYPAPEAGVGHFDLGRVEGVPPTPEGGTTPPPVTDEDPEFAFVKSKESIQLIKKINGNDANVAPGVVVDPGQPMKVTFEVTNTGEGALLDVTVTDDQIPSSAIRCEGVAGNVVDKLAAGASVTCTADYVAPEVGKQHTNVATVTGKPEQKRYPTPTPTPTPVTTIPGTTIPATTVEATTIPGTTVPGTTVPGTTIPGTTNATTTIPGTTDPGTTEPGTTEPGTSIPGSIIPETVVPGTTIVSEPEPTTTTPAPEPPVVEDHDPANAVVPAISIVKKINDDDANTAPGVEVKAGEDMDITYEVTNTGLATLKDVNVTDDNPVEGLTCPATELAPGATMTCKATLKAPAAGEQHTNIGTVEGTPYNQDGTRAKDRDGNDIPPVTDNDPANAKPVEKANSLGSIGDFVWEDQNGDGVQDPDEPGVEGVKVTLTKPDGSTVTTTTDKEGKYEFPGLQPGEYTVEFTMPKGFKETLTGSGTPETDSNGLKSVVTLKPGQSDKSVDLGLIKPGIVGDLVWYDKNKDGIQDPDEPGVPGATVKLYDMQGNLIGTKTTNAFGRYLFTNLAVGSYRVVFDLPEGFDDKTESGKGTADTDSNDFETVVNVTEDSQDISIDLGVIKNVELGSIGDFVWEDQNGDGIQDPNEPGVEGVKVTLTKPDGSTVTTTTDKDGKYEFPGLEPGDYKVSFELPAGFKETKTNVGDPSKDSNGLVTTVTLGAGETNKTVDLGLVKKKPGIPPLWPLIPLIPLIPGITPGGSSGSSEPPAPVPPAPGNPVPPAPGSPVQPAPGKPGESNTPGVEAVNKKPKGGVLASTGASVIGLTAVAALVLAAGVFLVRRRESK